MIRAAIVTPNLTLGGAERWVVDLVKHMDPSRIRFTGVAVSGYGGCDAGLAGELAGHTRLYANKPLGERPSHAKPFHWDLIHELMGPDFRKTVQRACREADVVVTWGSAGMRFWFDGLRIPRVLCSHTTYQEKPRGPVTGVTHLAAVSSAAMEYFDGRQGGESLPRRVIYNGADPERCRPIRGRDAIRAEWGVAANDIVVGYLGRQASEKNPLAPAKAVSALPDHYKAVYYGVGPTGVGPCPETREWCQRNISGRYQMYSAVSHVGDVLAGYDVLVLASHREAFSLSLIEAWLAGLPVVATPVGSVPEMQQRYGDLVFAVPRDPTAGELRLAVSLASTPKLRDRMSQRAQRIARRHFTVQRMCDCWADYLEEVVYGTL